MFKTIFISHFCISKVLKMLVKILNCSTLISVCQLNVSAYLLVPQCFISFEPFILVVPIKVKVKFSLEQATKAQEREYRYSSTLP